MFTPCNLNSFFFNSLGSYQKTNKTKQKTATDTQHGFIDTNLGESVLLYQDTRKCLSDIFPAIEQEVSHFQKILRHMF